MDPAGRAYYPAVVPDLRQVRCFVAVAERGSVRLVDLAPEPPPLASTITWQPDDTSPALDQFLAAAAGLAGERGWT